MTDSHEKEPAKWYTVDVICQNCLKEYNPILVFGKHLFNEECCNCRCKTLKPVKARKL